MKEVWFYTGLFMEDGITPITVRAANLIEAERFAKKGWREVRNETDAPARSAELEKNRRKDKPMKERKAVEKVVARIYKDRLKKTGRLPDGNEVKEMENKAKQAAENADRLKRRK